MLFAPPLGAKKSLVDSPGSARRSKTPKKSFDAADLFQKGGSSRRLGLFVYSNNIHFNMTQPPANPFYSTRLVLRCIACVLVTFSLFLLLAVIVHCELTPNPSGGGPHQQCLDGYPGNKWPLIGVITVLVFGGLEVIFMRLNKVRGGINYAILILEDAVFVALLLRIAINGFMAMPHIDVDWAFMAARIFILVTGFVSPFIWLRSSGE
jgi:hypothetical protein